MGDVPEPVDEDAARGTRLHAAWEKEDMTNLPPEDVEIYDRGLKLAAEAVSDWQQAFNLDFVAEGPREERLWLEDKASGQLDRHWFSPEYGLVLDFKSLWCKSLVPSELNWQLLLLAVLIAKKLELTHVRAVFAKAMFGQLDIVDFNENDLARAEYAIDQVLWASKHTPDRHPGLHCRHCKAATACPEAKAYVLLPSVQARALQGVTPTTAGPIVDNLTLEDCAKILTTATSRHNIEEAIKTRLKSLSDERLLALGLVRSKPQVIRAVSNVEGALSFLATVGIVDVQKALKINLGTLAEIVQKSLGQSSQKAADVWIKDKLSPFITETPKEASLQSIK